MTTKIVALIDALGNLINFRLLPGPAYDLRGTAARIERLSAGRLLADRAFDTNWLREALAKAGTQAVIPPKSNRRFPAEFDRDTRQLASSDRNFFGTLEEYRGIAKRCCKTDTRFAAFIALAASIIRLR